MKRRLDANEIIGITLISALYGLSYYLRAVVSPSTTPGEEVLKKGKCNTYKGICLSINIYFNKIPNLSNERLNSFGINKFVPIKFARFLWWLFRLCHKTNYSYLEIVCQPELNRTESDIELWKEIGR